MQRQAGVVENLVKKSQFTLFWDLVPTLAPPPIQIYAVLGTLSILSFDIGRIHPSLKTQI